MKNWIDIYDEIALKYNDPISMSGYLINGNPISIEYFIDWFNYIQSNINIVKDSKIIDVGCGSGIFLEFFQQISNNIYGIDTSLNQIQKAKELVPNANFNNGDALNFGFDDCTFDLIFCNSVFLLFESLDYAQNVLQYFISRLNINGKIWIGDLPGNDISLDVNYRRKGKSINLELQHYPVSFFDDFCEKNGYKGTKIEQTFKKEEFQNNRFDYKIELI